jgi:HK97 family phage portal protein
MKDSILTKVRGMLGGRRPANSPSVQVQYVGVAGAPGGAGGDYRMQVLQGFGRNSDVHSCISLVTNAAAQVKWWDGGAGTKALDKAGVAGGNPRASLEVLNRSGSQAFVRDWFAKMLLYGNAFSEIERANQAPSKLYAINPERVSVLRNTAAVHDEDIVKQWRIIDSSGRQYYRDPWREGAGDIIHTKQLNPIDPVFGLPPLQAAMLHIETQNQSLELTKQILERGHAPGWIKASPDSEWGENQLSALRDRVRYAKQAGSELFLENAEWHPMGFEVMSPGMVELQALSKRDIASVFNVDPVLIGDTSSRTYATYEQSRQALYMEAVLPLLSQFRDSWNTTIGAELNSMLEIDKDAFDAISNARAVATDRVTRAFQSGLVTQNEARRELEYDPVPNGDQFYAPASFIPMGKTEEE